MAGMGWLLMSGGCDREPQSVRLADASRQTIIEADKLGSVVDSGITVMNDSCEERDVYVVSSSCGCLALAEQSFTIPPRGSHELKFRARPISLAPRDQEIVFRCRQDGRIFRASVRVGARLGVLVEIAEREPQDSLRVGSYRDLGSLLIAVREREDLPALSWCVRPEAEAIELILGSARRVRSLRGVDTYEIPVGVAGRRAMPRVRYICEVALSWQDRQDVAGFDISIGVE